MLISYSIFLFVDSTGVILHDSLCKIFLHHTDPRCSVSVRLEKGIFSSSAFKLGFFQLVTLCKHKIQQVSDFLLILPYLLFL